MRISFRIAVAGDTNFFGSQQVVICDVGNDFVVVAEEHLDRWELTKEGIAAGVSAEFCELLSRTDQNVRSWKIPPKMIHSASFCMTVDSKGNLVERDVALTKAVSGDRSE